MSITPGRIAEIKKNAEECPEIPGPCQNCSDVLAIIAALEIERKRAEAAEGLVLVIRKGIARCLGGGSPVSPGSMVYSNAPYDKGYCNAITKALAVCDEQIDSARAQAGSKGGDSGE